MAPGRLSETLDYLRRMLTVAAAESDCQLLDRFVAAKDQDAFAALVERHGPVVWGVCSRVLGHDADAEDAFQATFLVLARQAGARRWRQSVGSWLYRVAYHTALRLREKIANRKRHEQRAVVPPPTATASHPEWSEIRQILDDELAHLPTRYRMPLLLSYLHGKSRDEVAQELGWSVGMVRGCLERGRDLLRDRLIRRGVALSAALPVHAWADGTVWAIPPAVVARTAQAAATGNCSPSVADLVQGAMQAMFWKKLRIAAGVCALLLLVVGAGLGFGVQQAASGVGLVSAEAAPDTVPRQREKNVQPAEGAERAGPVEAVGVLQAVQPTGKRHESYVFTFEIKTVARGDYKQRTVSFELYQDCGGKVLLEALGLKKFTAEELKKARGKDYVLKFTPGHGDPFPDLARALGIDAQARQIPYEKGTEITAVAACQAIQYLGGVGNVFDHQDFYDFTFKIQSVTQGDYAKRTVTFRLAGKAGGRDLCSALGVLGADGRLDPEKSKTVEQQAREFVLVFITANVPAWQARDGVDVTLLEPVKEKKQ